MEITRADVFAPVVSLIEAGSMLEALALYEACPYALTASVFCAAKDEAKAKKLAGRLRAGTVVINDLIAPTADARVPFCGRGASGFGATRGAEGLLEMTAVKTVIVRRGGAMRHLVATRASDAGLLAGMIEAVHGGGWRERWRAVMRVLTAARTKERKP
jgi:aldehyde dehydrogenase (NAD+)